MAPTRLVDEGGRFDALLLRSGLMDEPDPGALRRAESALGLGAGVALVGASASASKWSVLKLGSAHSLAKMGAIAVAKWVGAGFVSGVLAVCGIRYAAVYLREAPSPPAALGAHSSLGVAPATAPRRDAALADKPRRDAAPAADARRGAVTAAEPRRDAALAAEPRRDAALAAEPHGAAPVAAPRRGAAHEAPQLPPPRPTRVPGANAAPAQETAEAARSIPSTAANFPSPDSPSEAAIQQENALADEVAILERARRALFAGRPDATLQELDDYDRLPNKAVLRSEAGLLRIEALMRKGNVGAAQALARRSLQRAPNGPHARRLREIVASP